VSTDHNLNEHTVVNMDFNEMSGVNRKR